MPIIGIYCIQHTKSGKRYIGKSIDVKSRLKTHKCNLTSSTRATHGINRHLYSAVQQYGWGEFITSILEQFDVVDEAKIAQRELYWIDFYNTTVTGYNLRRDSSTGMIVHESTRRLHAEAAVRVHTGLKRSDKTKANLFKALKGKLIGRKQTPEHVANRMASAKGTKRNYIMSESHRQAIILANRGKPKSEETKRKMSEARMGHIPTDETRANMAKAQKLIAKVGIPRSDIVRAKISAGHQRRMQRIASDKNGL